MCTHEEEHEKKRRKKSVWNCKLAFIVIVICECNKNDTIKLNFCCCDKLNVNKGIVLQEYATVGITGKFF